MFKNQNQLMNALYCLAKLRYKNQYGNGYIDEAMEQLVKEPKLSYVVASKNLWNLYALDHFNKVAVDCFTRVIVDTKPELIKPIDIASAMRAYAHFQHLDYDCMEMLLKIAISRTREFNLQTLAVTLNSFAELDITNETLLQISKQYLLE